MCLSPPSREEYDAGYEKTCAVPFFCSPRTVDRCERTSQAVTRADFTGVSRAWVSFDILSDTKGTQLNSYLGTLAPELKQSFLSNLSVADAKPLAHQQVDLLVTIDSQGKVSALRLAPGTQDSPVARAAWAAVKDNKCASLPNSLGGSDLKLRVHFVAA